MTTFASGHGVGRSLENGWDYSPGWRVCQINVYLDEIAQLSDHKAALQEILFHEKDPFVRQGLRFRLDGQCAATAAFAWAERCARDNGRTGALSMLRALVLAGLSPELIAAELGTKRFNVVVAEKLFADFRRYLRQRVWLSVAVIDVPQDGSFTPEVARERMWLRVAFDGGAHRLLAVLRGTEDFSGEALESTAQQIEVVTGRRALEYVRGLDRQAAPATEDDLKRYLLARSVRSREAATTANEQQNKVKEWGLGLVKMLSEKRENWDAKTIEGATRILPMQKLGEEMVARIEAKSELARKESSTEQQALALRGAELED